MCALFNGATNGTESSGAEIASAFDTKRKKEADMRADLEHVNITASNPARTADMLVRLFNWRIRCRGPSRGGGVTYHVGGDDFYVALYAAPGNASASAAVEAQGHPNHIGVTVDNLDAAETRVCAAGFKPYDHADYDPGRRFYFRGPDDIEIEVVSYD